MGIKKFVFVLVSVIIFIPSEAAKHQGEYRYQDRRCEPEFQHIRRLFGLLPNESSIRSNHSESPPEPSSNHQESPSKTMVPLMKNSSAHPSLPASNQHLLLGIRKMGYLREHLAKSTNESSIRLNHPGSPSKTGSNHSGSPSETSKPKTMMPLKKNSSAHPSLPASNHPGSCPAPTHNVTATGLEKILAGFADTVRKYIVTVSLMMILLSLIDSII